MASNLDSYLLFKQRYKADRVVSKAVTNPCFQQPDWMADKILDLMNERRKLKNGREELLRKRDKFNIHQKLKEVTGTNKNKTNILLEDGLGHVFSKRKKLLNKWDEIENLFEYEIDEI